MFDEYGDIDVHCDGELVGNCPTDHGRYIHDCEHAYEHAGPHECACGRYLDRSQGRKRQCLTSAAA